MHLVARAKKIKRGTIEGMKKMPSVFENMNLFPFYKNRRAVRSLPQLMIQASP
jgi:hypothetical protein